jgi:LPXTG-motif cell wall-anchored protein
MEGEDSPYGPCLLWISSTRTAPFEAGHRHYVCTVPFGVAAGKSQFFELWVKTDKGYDGAKGTATVRPGPAGIPLHDPDVSNDSVTFAFGASATPNAAVPSGHTLAATGAGRTTLVATAAGGVALLGGMVLIVRRRRGSSH